MVTEQSIQTIPAWHRTLRDFWMTQYHNLQNLNLFKNALTSSSSHELHNQLISTRFFILALFTSFTVLIIYNSSINSVHTITIASPSLKQYFQLYEEYPETLSCSCTHIAIDFKTFVEVNYTLHQLCSSDFVTNHWIHHLSRAILGKTVKAIDFRLTGPFSFQALRSFCNLSNDTITDDLNRFYAIRYVSMHVIPTIAFQFEIGAFIKQYQALITKEFLTSFQIASGVIQDNAIFPVTQSNGAFYFLPTENHATIEMLGYDDCSCLFSSKCFSTATFYDQSGFAKLFEVPGLKTGCYVLESLLQSSLECFYNETCLSLLNMHLGYPNSSFMVVMNATGNDRSALNSTVHDLLEELFVETWNHTIFFANYFHECKPSRCSYSERKESSAIYVLTSVIGIIGGLVTVLRILVPKIIGCIRCRRRRSEQIAKGKILKVLGIR